MRVILTALTDHLEIDVQFKAICSPVKTSYLPVENFNETPDNRDNLRVDFRSLYLPKMLGEHCQPTGVAKAIKLVEMLNPLVSVQFTVRVGKPVFLLFISEGCH